MGSCLGKLNFFKKKEDPYAYQSQTSEPETFRSGSFKNVNPWEAASVDITRSQYNAFVSGSIYDN